MPKDTKLHNCNSTEEMKAINKYILDFSMIQSKYEPPCNEMKLVATFSQQKNEYGHKFSVFLNFVYMERTYQQIINVEDFGFESFWSGVGGFVGIFMGSSLLQVPKLLIMMWNW